MLPLLELRNDLDVADDRHLRDFRRMNGSVQLFHDKPIPGPYTQEARERWLTRLLEAQAWIRTERSRLRQSLELVTLAELEEIRRHLGRRQARVRGQRATHLSRRRSVSPIPAGRSMSTFPWARGSRRPARGRRRRSSAFRTRTRTPRHRAAAPIAGASRRAVRVAREGSSSRLLRRRGGRHCPSAHRRTPWTASTRQLRSMSPTRSTSRTASSGQLETEARSDPRPTCPAQRGHLRRTSHHRTHATVCQEADRSDRRPQRGRQDDGARSHPPGALWAAGTGVAIDDQAATTTTYGG